VSSKPEDREVVVAENVKMVDIQDKEVTMEGICSIAAYDEWTPLSVSGQPPKPRYKVLVVFICWLPSNFVLDCILFLVLTYCLQLRSAAWSCCCSGKDVCLWWKPQWPLPW
jgi:hypothetical protein